MNSSQDFGGDTMRAEIVAYMIYLEGLEYLSTSDFQSEVGEVSANLVANFRRSLEGDFRASFAGKTIRSIFHQNSTANFTFKLHYAVRGCGGP